MKMRRQETGGAARCRAHASQQEQPEPGPETADYFLRRPRITSSVPASNASALPAEAGSISGTAAIATTPEPIPNNMSANNFCINFLLLTNLLTCLLVWQTPPLTSKKLNIKFYAKSTV